MRTLAAVLAVVVSASAARAQVPGPAPGEDPVVWVDGQVARWLDARDEGARAGVALRLLEALRREDVDLRAACVAARGEYVRTDARALLFELASVPRDGGPGVRDLLDLARLLATPAEPDAVLRPALVRAGLEARTEPICEVLGALSILVPDSPELRALRWRHGRLDRAVRVAVRALDALGLPDPGRALPVTVCVEARRPPLPPRGCRGGGVLVFDDADVVAGWALRGPDGGWSALLDDLRVLPIGAPASWCPPVRDSLRAVFARARTLREALGPGLFQPGILNGPVSEDAAPCAGTVRDALQAPWAALDRLAAALGPGRFEREEDDELALAPGALAVDLVPDEVGAGRGIRSIDLRTLPLDRDERCDGCAACCVDCEGCHGHVDDATRVWLATREGRPWLALDLLAGLCDAEGHGPEQVVGDALVARAGTISASLAHAPTVDPDERADRLQRALALLDAADGLGRDSRAHGRRCELEPARLRTSITAQLAAVAVARSTAAPPLPSWSAWRELGPDERMAHVVAALADLSGGEPMVLPGSPRRAPRTRRAHALELGWAALPALIELVGQGWLAGTGRELRPVAELASGWIASITEVSPVSFAEVDLSDPWTRAAMHRDLAAWWAARGRRGAVAYHLDGALRRSEPRHLEWLIEHHAAPSVLRALYLAREPSERGELLLSLGSPGGALTDDDLRREAWDPELGPQAQELLLLRGGDETGADLIRDAVRRDHDVDMVIARVQDLRPRALGLIQAGREEPPVALAVASFDTRRGDVHAAGWLAGLLRAIPAGAEVSPATVDAVDALAGVLPLAAHALVDAPCWAVARRATELRAAALGSDDGLESFARRAARALRAGDTNAVGQLDLVVSRAPDALPGVIAGVGPSIALEELVHALSAGPPDSPGVTLAFALVSRPLSGPIEDEPALVELAERVWWKDGRLSPRSAVERLDLVHDALAAPGVARLVEGDALVARAVLELAGDLGAAAEPALASTGAPRGLLDLAWRWRGAPRVLGLAPVSRGAEQRVRALAVEPTIDRVELDRSLPLLLQAGEPWAGQPVRLARFVALLDRWELTAEPALEVRVERAPWGPVVVRVAPCPAVRSSDWTLSVHATGPRTSRLDVSSARTSYASRVARLIQGLDEVFLGPDRGAPIRVVVRASRPRG